MTDRFKVNAESYAAFVEAFRAAGAGTGMFTPNFRVVGASMGTTEHTAKRAWLVGFPALSRNYGPIQDLFPRLEPIVPEAVKPDISSRMVTYGHDDTIRDNTQPVASVPPRPEPIVPEVVKTPTGDFSPMGSRDPGDFSPMGSRDPSASVPGPPEVDAANAHDVGAPHHTPTYSHPPITTPAAPAHTPAQLVNPTDFSTQLDRLVGKAPEVLVREWDALAVSRNNAIGINVLMGKVIEKLMAEVPRLLQLDGMELTLANFTQIAQDVAKVTTLLTAAQGKLMESQRLLLNMPSVITEHRTRPTGPVEESPELEAKRARLAPLVALLAAVGPTQYKGEEGGADVLGTGGETVGNTGRFVTSTGTGGGVHAKDVAQTNSDNVQTTDPLLSIR